MHKGKHFVQPKKKKRRIKKKILVLILLCALIYSGYNIYNWKKDSNNTQEQAEQYSNQVEIAEIVDNENTQIVESDEEETNPYWDYIKMNLLDVDFTELEKINKDVKGWIQVNGTNINYPFVQTSNNDYYLTHSFNRDYNSAGWIFMDYRNNINNLEKNTILYGHSRLDKTMFGSLKNLLKSDWYNDKNNHIIKLSTNNTNTLWQVFSVYHIEDTSDYIKTDFKSDEEFQEFAQKLKNRSVYDFNTTVSKNDKILTLSTCYKNNNRMVMHAKLIKYENK